MALAAITPGTGDPLPSMGGIRSEVESGILFLLPVEDHNGFFSTDPGTHLSEVIQRVTRLVKKVFIDRIETIEEMGEMIACHASVVDTVVLCGHGTSTSLQFGSDEAKGRPILTVDTVTPELFLPLSERAGKVLLFSCETGKGGRRSLAYRINQISKMIVVAPSVIIYDHLYSENPLLPHDRAAFPFCISSALKYDGEGEGKLMPTLEQHFLCTPLLPKILESIATGELEDTAEKGALVLLEAAKMGGGRIEDALDVARTIKDQSKIRNMAETFRSKGFDEEAIELFSLIGDDEARGDIASIYIRRGAFDRVEEIVSEISDDGILYSIARAFLKRWKNEKSKNVGLRLTNKTYRLILAQKFCENGLFDEAVELVNCPGELRCALDFCERLYPLCGRKRFIQIALRALRECERVQLIAFLLRRKTYTTLPHRVIIDECVSALSRSIGTEIESFNLFKIFLARRLFEEAFKASWKIESEPLLSAVVKELIVARYLETAFIVSRKIRSPFHINELVDWLVPRYYLSLVSSIINDRKDPEIEMRVVRQLYRMRRIGLAQDFFDKLSETHQVQLRREGIFRRRIGFLESLAPAQHARLVREAAGKVRR